MIKGVRGWGQCLVLCAVVGVGGCAHQSPPSLPAVPAVTINSQAVPQETVARHEPHSGTPTPEEGRERGARLQNLKRGQAIMVHEAVVLEDRAQAMEPQAAEPDSRDPEDILPEERVRQLLQQLEEERLEEEVDLFRDLSPRERARRLLELEEEAGLEDEAVEDIIEEIETRERVQHLLGVYAEAMGIYDEILREIQPGPGYIARKAGLPDWLILGGEHRTRYEYMNGQFRRGLRSVDQQLSHRSRLFFAIREIFDPFRFTLELQDSRVHLTYADSNATTDHINETDIQQLHVDLVFPDFFNTGLPTEIQMGRVNMDLGLGRARWVARNNYRNVTNAYDGVYWRLGAPQGLQSHTFAVWPVDREMRSLDPFFDENQNLLWGTYTLLPPLQALPWLRTELIYHGHRSRGPHRDFDMLGYRLLKEGGIRRWEFEIESEYQFGDINEFASFAHFHHGELGYTFALPWKPQLLLKFDYASPGFDILYGRRSFELTPTGILGPFQRTNLIFPGYRVLLQPTNRFYLFFQHRAAWLADPTVPWLRTGLSDPTGSAGSFLGQTLEIRARWQVLDNVFLQAGYFHFAFGSFPRNAPATPVDRDMNYLYFWTEFMF